MTDRSWSAAADATRDDPDAPYRAPHRPISEVPVAVPDYAEARRPLPPERDQPIGPGHVPQSPESYEPAPVFGDDPAIIVLVPEPPAVTQPIAVVPLSSPATPELPAELIDDVPVTALVPEPSAPPSVPEDPPELIVGVPSEVPPVAAAPEADPPPPPATRRGWRRLLGDG